MVSLFAEENPEIWMPDPNLRVIVRSRLGLADDVPLTQQAVRELRTLTAKDSGISDLTGLEHATALRKLNLSGNNISEMNALSNLTHLEWLYLDKNHISDVSGLSRLTNLKHLSLQDNNISDVSPLSSLRKLTGLGLGNNRSDVGGNNISDVSALSNLRWLYWLYLQHNNISDVRALSNLTRLRILHLSGNNISDVSPLSRATKLHWLYLQNNNISDVSVLSDMIKLTWLFLHNNNISDVSALSDLTNLAVLTLYGNPILDTSPLYPLTQQQPFSLFVSIEIPKYPPWDINEDGSVDAIDSALVSDALEQSGAGIENRRTDVNGDGVVNLEDLALVNNNLASAGAEAGNTATPDAIDDMADLLLSPAQLKTMDRAGLEAALDILRVESDGSLKYQRVIGLLENHLASLRPSETRLLANYPNPFNPETWIPYHLSDASDVRITIYNVRGQVVKRLDIGHQSAGTYTSRQQAAYWDGTNDIGEKVSSGVYFCQLQANNISLLRKMVISE